MVSSRHQSNPWYPREWVTRAGSATQLLIWINIAVFVVQLLCTALHLPQFESLLSLHTDDVRRGFLWQPLTYMFLHDGLWHLLINLFVLWFFGREVEYFLHARQFTRLYFLGGLAGAAFWLLFNFHSTTPVIGASAAVLACVIAFATLFPDREITLLLFFIIPIRLKAKHLALVAIALDAAPLLIGTNTNIAHLAHLGGAGFGYLYVKSLGYGRPLRWLSLLQSLRPAPRQKNDDEKFMRDEIDPILDKISREGMQSLTARERKILESARDLLQKRNR